jgi:hypothetical protein
VRTEQSAQWIPREEALRRAAVRQHRIIKEIRNAARAQRLSLIDLADFADVHPNTVRDILKGTSHANLATLAVLARAVDLDVRIGIGPFHGSATAIGDENDTESQP